LSLSCTLHPVDHRLADSLAGTIRGERSDWDFFKRLWLKKRLINRINQPFKKGLPDLLTDCPPWKTELIIRGRPFLIAAADPGTVTVKINKLYSLARPADIIQFYLNELRDLSEAAYRQRLTLSYPLPREPDLGLTEILRKLRSGYRRQKYEELGAETGFILAQLAGSAYPYWEMESYGLTFLRQLEPDHWVNEPDGLQGLFHNLAETAAYFPKSLDRGLAAGIYLDPLEVAELLEILSLDAPRLQLKMAEKQIPPKTVRLYLQKLAEVLTYARNHGYGVLEAADIWEEKEPLRYP